MHQWLALRGHPWHKVSHPLLERLQMMYKEFDANERRITDILLNELAPFGLGKYGGDLSMR
jgi:hypothetical protein